MKPEKVILLTDEWRIYAETDILEEWIQQEDGSVVRVDHYWHKVLQLKTPLGKQKFDVLAKTVKCALSLSHGNADNERSLSTRKLTKDKERSNLSTITLNGLRATEDGVKSLNGLSHMTNQRHVVLCERLTQSLYGTHRNRKEEGAQEEM